MRHACHREGGTHLVLSIGGNDALDSIERLARPTETVRMALGHLNEIRSDFRRAYRAMLWQLLALSRPLAVRTIYDAVPNLAADLQAALCLFNEKIVREQSSWPEHFFARVKLMATKAHLVSLCAAMMKVFNARGVKP